VHFENNWMLLTIGEETQAVCHTPVNDLNSLPQFVPSELIEDTDVSNPSYVLAVRLAWRQAVSDALGEPANSTKHASEQGRNAWLHRLLHLEKHPGVWKQAPSANARQEMRDRFEQSLAQRLHLPKNDLLKMGGSSGVAIATLHGQTLSPPEQAALASAAGKASKASSPKDNVDLVIGLKAAAFRDAFLELARPAGLNTAYTSADAALRLTLTFGKSWKNWLVSRARTIREPAGDQTFVHDASFWLPIEPVNKLTGLSDWLFQPQHKGKPINELGIIAKHWSSLEPEDRKLPYRALLERACAKAYPGAKNAQLASEAASWGTDASDYAEIEERHMASLAVPSPFPLHRRWSIDGLSARFLPRDDVRGLFLGQHTDCCQHPDGQGDTAAWYGQEKANAGFFVVEDKHGNVVAQSMVWIARNGKGLVFDSAECKRLGAREAAVVAIYSEAARELSSAFAVVTLGTGTDKLKAKQRWPEAGDQSLKLPKGDKPYTDSGSQVLLAAAINTGSPECLASV
jgi:hypothetical protein